MASARRQSSQAHLVLWARYVDRSFANRAPRVVYLALGIIDGLVTYDGESQGGRVGKRLASRVLPGASRVVNGSVRGPHDYPRTISSTVRCFHPPAEKPRPASSPLDPLSLDPSVGPRWLARHAFDATRGRWGRDDDERLGTLRCKGWMRECAVTRAQRESTDCNEKWAKH